MNKIFKQILYILLIILLIICIQFIIKYNNKEFFNETIDTTTNNIKIKCFKGDNIICKYLTDTHNWEEHISKKLIEYYKPNSNFIDIGSNYGVHSLYVANYIKNNKFNGKVYSYEIQPKIYDLFITNISDNHLNDYINPYLIGLSNIDNTMNVDFINNYDYGNNPGGTSIIDIDNKNLNKDNLISTSVILKQLDSFNINNVSIIKIDVEGYELLTLEGSLNTIMNNKPVILIEIWNKNLEEYKNWFIKNLPNYKLENISNDDYILSPV